MHNFTESLTNYKRRVSNGITIGSIRMGGENPIRIQSMTNTNTLDTSKSVEQCIKIIQAGGELVRLTTQGVSEAENLKNIKAELTKKGYNTPIVADVHFNSKVANTAAKIVEKVRINPGNYSDKDSLDTKFIEFLNICKENNTAIRIGVNHGSLSERMLNKYGNTPTGMVESAMEFLRICQKQDFSNVVVSIKASNTKIMVYAYRLLVINMQQENMHFPLHLGVTEAGNGEDGRIKSAVGIGALLSDGIGDTIRVSLTEKPEAEIPVAKMLVSYILSKSKHTLLDEISPFYNPVLYSKVACRSVLNIGDNNLPIIIGDVKNKDLINPPDFYYIDNIEEIAEMHTNNNILLKYSDWKDLSDKSKIFPLISDIEYLQNNLIEGIKFIETTINTFSNKLITSLQNDKKSVLIINSIHFNCIGELRIMFSKLSAAKCTVPVILKKIYTENDFKAFQIQSAIDLGSLLIDGFGNGLWLRNKNFKKQALTTSFNILQATGSRFSKTDFIACPSCGRTLFDLQKTLEKVKIQTAHLKGLKIAVMGCIVNGIGEMADADYGYVGAGQGKISLYKNKKLIKNNIPEQEAIDELIKLIKQNNDWIDNNQ